MCGLVLQWVVLKLQLYWMPMVLSLIVLVIVSTLFEMVPNIILPLNSESRGFELIFWNDQGPNSSKAIENPGVQKSCFSEFKRVYSKQYSNGHQEVYRSLVYYQNIQMMNSHNENPKRKYNMGLNSFADLTPLQFSYTFNTLLKSNPQIQSFSQFLAKEKQYQISPQSADSDSINSSAPIGNIQDRLTEVKQTIRQNLYAKQSHLISHNPQFFHLQSTLNSNSIGSKFTHTKNQQLLKYLPHHYKTNPAQLLPNHNFTSSNPSISSLHFSPYLQTQIDSIIQTTLHSVPLKLTSTTDWGLMTSFPLASSTSSNSSNFTSTSNVSNSGNFTTSVIDWTVHAGKIRYQGICGACYTFATSDVVASLYAIYKFGFFVALSTQQVVDCSTNGLTYGCNGGFLEGSYAYMQIKGIQTDENYPYTSAVSGFSGKCKKDGGTFKVASFRNIEEGNCKALVNQLNYGPVSVGIAGYRLQFYSNGVFNDCNSYVDHAVVLIAYKAGVGWKIKNSWGAEWGMAGFAWIADGNNCGICSMGVSARI